MKKNLKPKLLFLLFIPVLFILSAGKTYAAKLFVETSADNNELSIYLNSEGSAINAVDLVFGFNPKDFLVTGISDGNSIINLWVESPSFGNNTGEIHLTGAIPGGFSGTRGLLAKILFQPEKTGRTGLILKQASVLLNDGSGSQAKISANQLNFILSASSSSLEADTAPPEAFTSEIASSSDIFGGQWFLVFSTADKGSGIDHYEIMELPPGSAFNISGPWVTGTSPYLLKDQLLGSDIYVRAIDKKGNFTVAKISAAQKEGIPIAIYLLFGIALLLLIVITYRRVKRGGR